MTTKERGAASWSSRTGERKFVRLLLPTSNAHRMSTIGARVVLHCSLVRHAMIDARVMLQYSLARQAMIDARAVLQCSLVRQAMIDARVVLQCSLVRQAMIDARVVLQCSPVRHAFFRCECNCRPLVSLPTCRARAVPLFTYRVKTTAVGYAVHSPHTLNSSNTLCTALTRSTHRIRCAAHAHCSTRRIRCAASHTLLNSLPRVAGVPSSRPSSLEQRSDCESSCTSLPRTAFSSRRAEARGSLAPSPSTCLEVLATRASSHRPTTSSRALGRPRQRPKLPSTAMSTRCAMLILCTAHKPCKHIW
jgi:hypothetical protein